MILITLGSEKLNEFQTCGAKIILQNGVAFSACCVSSRVSVIQYPRWPREITKSVFFIFDSQVGSKLVPVSTSTLVSRRFVFFFLPQHSALFRRLEVEQEKIKILWHRSNDRNLSSLSQKGLIETCVVPQNIKEFRESDKWMANL